MRIFTFNTNRYRLGFCKAWLNFLVLFVFLASAQGAFAQYCAVSATYTSDYTSAFSTSGAASNVSYSASSLPAGSYADQTGDVIEQAQGLAFSFSTSYVGGGQAVKIWVDWNDDGVFNNTTGDAEIVYSAYTPNLTQTGTISIPASAELGSYRVRVRSQYGSGDITPCGAVTWGSTIDFTLQVLDAPSCLPPTALTAGNITLTSADLSWSSDGSLFDIQWGEAPFALGEGTEIVGVTNNYTLNDLSSDVKYQYYVRRDCGAGDTSYWSGPYTFLTGYCEVSIQYTGDYLSSFSTSGAVSNVQYTATSNPTGTSYVNLTEEVIEQAQGLSLDFASSYQGGGQKVNIWVDWNNDLTFDNSPGSTEKIFSQYVAGASQTGNITIPLDTEIGTYRVRVRAQYGTGDLSPCGQAIYGTTLDYTLNVLPAPSCFPPTVLGVENTTYESAELTWTSDGTLFDIQYGEAPFEIGGGTEILGVTTNPYLLTDLSPETAYQFYVRNDCTTEQSYWSGPFDFYTGYCIPPASTYPSSYLINNVFTSGGFTNITNLTGTTPSAASYGLFTDMAITQSPGGEFTYNVMVPTYTNVEVWIDFNQNLVFDAEEMIGVYPYVTTANTTFTGTVVLPSDLPLGDYRMRVRSRYYYLTNASACGPAEYGETEDYTIAVVTPPSCLPPTDLTVTDLTAESAVLSWESAGTLFDIEYGEAPFQMGEGTLLENQTNNFLLEGLGEDTSYQYYVRLVCPSEESLWAGPFTFFTGYCAVSTLYGDYISSFTTSGALENVVYTATDQVEGSYSNLTDEVIEQAQGLSFDFSTTYVGGGQKVNVWIDWNNDLTFDNSVGSTEKVYSNYFSGATQGGNIIIPADVAVGAYRVRIRSAYGNLPILSPCGEVSYGSTLDYTLNVIPAPTCFPPTVLGVQNTTFNSTELVWTSTGSLFDIQWGEAPFEIGSGTEINDVSASPYLLSGLQAETAYQFYVRQDCTSEQSYWSGPYNFYTGYCLVSPSTFPTSYIINNVSTLGGFTNISNNTGTTASAGSYGDFTDNSVSQSPGGEFTYSIVVPSFTNLEMWADLNQNLVFDADELIATHPYVTTGPVTFSGTITLPADLPLGDYRIRVRSRYYFETTASACAPAQYGETEDYTLSVIATPACLPPSDLGIANLTTTSVDLTWASTGTAFEVQYGVAPLTLGQGTIVPATGTSLSLSNLPVTTSYQYYVRQNCGGEDGDSLWSGPFNFSTLTPGHIGDGSTTTSTYFPINSCYGFSYSQQIYLASELQVALEPNATVITEIRFKPTGLPATMASSNNWVLYLGNTTQSLFSSTNNWVPNADMQEVFSGVLSFTANEWVTIQLDTPYTWDGTSNLVVGIDENVSGYNCTANFASYPAGSNRGMIYYNDNINPDPSGTLPAANFGPDSNIAQIQIGAELLSNSNFDNNSFTAYPNPVKDILNVSFTQNISEVAVYNLLGQQVLFVNMNANKGQIDMSSLTSGTYLVKVKTENAVQTIKVIKQ